MKVNRIVSVIFITALAGGLLYLSLSKVNFSDLWKLLQKANYLYLVPTLFFMLLSHFFRGWRWQLMLQALPEKQHPVSIKTSFYSVMIGYMLNYALPIPRIGEIGRAYHSSTQEDLPLSSVLGTVAADRILDMIVFALIWIPLLFLAPQKFDLAINTYLVPFWQKHQISVLLAIFLTVILILLFVYITKKRGTSKPSKIVHLKASFIEGLQTTYATGKTFSMILLTIGIWGCYVLMVHFPFYMFGIDAITTWTLVDSYVLMVLGGLAILAPTPGGVGAFHFVIIETLVLLWGLPREFSAGYAIFTHGAQLIIYTILGVIFLLLEGGSVRKFVQFITSRNA